MTVLVAAYLASIVLANLMVAWLGAWSMAANAFLFIGLDLAVRDGLHDRWRAMPMGVWPRMAALIAFGSALTFALCPDAGRVAAGSAAAFAAASAADAVVYNFLLASGWGWSARSNASNVAGAAVDSVLFCPLALGAVLPLPMMVQFLAKSLGGFVWALLLGRFAPGGRG